MGCTCFACSGANVLTYTGEVKACCVDNSQAVCTLAGQQPKKPTSPCSRLWPGRDCGREDRLWPGRSIMAGKIDCGQVDCGQELRREDAD